MPNNLGIIFWKYFYSKNLQKYIVKTCKNIYLDYTVFMVKTVKNISDIFVKKIVQKWQKILSKDEIIKIWMASGWAENRLSYALSLLKNLQILTKISQDFYLINSDSPLDFYWRAIQKIIAKNTLKWAVVAGEKGIELLSKNASPPEILIVYTDDFSARMRLFDGYEVHFRTIQTGEKMGRKNFFSILKRYSTQFENFSKIFVPNAEIALLEALSCREQEIGKNDFLVMKFLKKNHNKLQWHIFQEIVKFRYIRAVNRLRILARDTWYDYLYKATLDAIKFSGGGVFLNID